MFAATGVTDGNMLKGVKNEGLCFSESIVKDLQLRLKKK